MGYELSTPSWWPKKEETIGMQEYLESQYYNDDASVFTLMADAEKYS